MLYVQCQVPSAAAIQDDRVREREKPQAPASGQVNTLFFHVCCACACVRVCVCVCVVAFDLTMFFVVGQSEGLLGGGAALLGLKW